MGITLIGVTSASSAARTLKYHRQNLKDVFVTTVQRIDAALSGRISRQLVGR